MHDASPRHVLAELSLAAGRPPAREQLSWWQNARPMDPFYPADRAGRVGIGRGLERTFTIRPAWRDQVAVKGTIPTTWVHHGTPFLWKRSFLFQGQQDRWRGNPEGVVGREPASGFVFSQNRDQVANQLRGDRCMTRQARTRPRPHGFLDPADSAPVYGARVRCLPRRFSLPIFRRVSWRRRFIEAGRRS